MDMIAAAGLVVVAGAGLFVLVSAVLATFGAFVGGVVTGVIAGLIAAVPITAWMHAAERETDECY